MDGTEAFLLGTAVRQQTQISDYNGLIQAHIAKGMTYEQAKAETDRIWAIKHPPRKKMDSATKKSWIWIGAVFGGLFLADFIAHWP